MDKNCKSKQNFNVNQNNVGIIYSATIVAYFLFSLIINLILSVVTIGDFLKRFILSFCSIIVLSTVIFLFGVKSDGNVSDNLSFKKFKPVYLMHVIFVLMAMFFGLGLLNSFVAQLFNVVSSPLEINSVWEYLLFVLSICILPAVVEEIFFRGMVQKALESFGTFFSIFITALLFSLYHLNVTQLAYQFIFGVLFGGLFYLSKSVFPGMILHFLNNFFVLTLSFFNLSEQIEILLGQVGVIIAGCLMLVTLLIFGFIKVYKRRQEHVIDKGVKRNFFIYSLLGVLICIVQVVVGAI